MWVSGALLVTGKSLKGSQYMKTLNYQPVWGLDQQPSSCKGDWLHVWAEKQGGTSVGGGRQRNEGEIKASVPD